MANKKLWRDELTIDIYEMSKEGTREKVISGILGISYATFLSWKVKYPLVKMALTKGREVYKKKRISHKNNQTSEISDYVFSRLTPEMKKIWNKLAKIDRVCGGKQMIDAILEGYGRHYRQHLFLYAFVNGNFSLTDACRKVGISVRTFQLWRDTDPDFHQLFKDANEAKKDFIETHLQRLVENGSEAATIFSAKTQLRDRGYDEKGKLEIEVNGKIQHSSLPFEEIRQFLSPECQMEILEACRKRKSIESNVIQNPIGSLTGNVTGNILDAVTERKEE